LTSACIRLLDDATFTGGALVKDQPVQEVHDHQLMFPYIDGHLGNSLGPYWRARVEDQLSGRTFKSREVDHQYKDVSILGKLPTLVPAEPGPDLTAYWKKKITCTGGHGCGMYPAIIGAIRRDTQAAIKSWLADTGNELAPLEKDSVVVHFRCGDIVKPDGGNPEYGVISFPWVASVIPKQTSEILIVGNVKATMSGRAHGLADKGADDKCVFLLEHLMRYLKENTGVDDVRFVSKGPNEDFGLLVGSQVQV
jgi:hypothetical protein